MAKLESDYVLQKDEKSFCPNCRGQVEMLCREDGNIRAAPWFYICWVCQLVFELGRGRVKRD